MTQHATAATDYIGRFAPSPTGSLHFGSLLAALASYLDARSQQGRWLVRMEDLDPPREVPGAADQILHTLETFGFEWDGPVWYQSQRHPDYQQVLEQLIATGAAYGCDCSRSQILLRKSRVYDGYCRQRQPIESDLPLAIRLCVDDETIVFTDAIQGPQRQQLATEVGDFVIRRRDGLFAYQLAVVIDDAAQGVNQVVRGYDLLSSTARQIHLQQQLELPTPSYAHIPILVNAMGQKLSKQTYASAIDATNPGPSLYQALQLLGQQPPESLRQAQAHEILTWGCEHWQLTQIPRQPHLPESLLETEHR
ncbi:tRNA glutamyl-Q(34) synthetase GluQRS [Motiliproteus coralliicola]|uniref:Glutamyl-Q tRNA(Asp) synthetase n=1 Tax=Motiliproteus coralliicola TaxID=2283196 RepID=A0A369W812_9GAMM|nr:tRNA glutamyl-Q(34) synthetase GluQRS [Motiliproteus coralliicola]RDE18052.1 tRNA glutamyl-Q(34) synthetase GluQRS [Motiliproteus coralliicola]